MCLGWSEFRSEEMEKLFWMHGRSRFAQRDVWHVTFAGETGLSICSVQLE